MQFKVHYYVKPGRGAGRGGNARRLLDPMAYGLHVHNVYTPSLHNPFPSPLASPA